MSASLVPRAMTENGRQRVIIEGVTPEIDCGRFAAKRTVGDRVQVEADIFTDGHDAISAVLCYRREKDSNWSETPMRALVNDRWTGEFSAAELGRYRYTLRAWVDHWETWLRDLRKRIQAESDTPLDYQIGAELIEDAAGRAKGDDAQQLRARAKDLRTESDSIKRRTLAVDVVLHALMTLYPDRRFETQYHRELAIVVDPVRARFSTWYEMFPRSASPDPARHGTFADCEARLPYVAEMGFDVLYLPPIHPIGTKFRKGKNNSVNSEPGDVGSPWAIGAAEGGHKSILAELGTLEEFRHFVERAKEYGIDIALDIAFQVSPDHPYVTEHENWFKKRPDGTIQYAENPPKKYQDIYPFDYETEDWQGLWQELKSVFEFWIENGVRIFRVDNPHTKAFPFWEWVITELKKKTPEVLFLSEAFTRPKIMYRLAKLGFSQSYTYFPWRNAKREITEYLTELTQTPVHEFFRPNQWPNTPDILTEFLQIGTRSAFLIRFFLAATLGANYGMYGPAFELMESKPVRQGSEEYLDSEKYQRRVWDLERPDSLREFIALVNRIRHQNPALQNDWTLQFHPVDNEQLLCYSKNAPDGSNLLLMVVNLDPHYVQSGFVDLPLRKLGIEEDRPYQANDLLTGAHYVWSGPRNYVELRPESLPGHILQIRRRLRVENDFEYFL
ncbi:MAG TPA: alpha-1,4-glucan--maltose-1-phosphate maltosyltransferase [Bryobacteraceae bacterium]|nr:alpha-1,4-glucan--maltose-1-phosphate maltosyltransferase [Bryobacteraceae bacterium]